MRITASIPSHGRFHQLDISRWICSRGCNRHPRRQPWKPPQTDGPVQLQENQLLPLGNPHKCRRQRVAKQPAVKYSFGGFVPGTADWSQMNDYSI